MSDIDPISERRRAFWADAVADAIEERDPEDPIVVKGGVSPSGVPHIGHVNEIMRGYFVAEALRDRGHEVRQVFTSDDRDRLRAVPRKLASLDGEIVGLGEVDAGALGRNLGKPLTDVPDPFGCCDSFGDHQTELLRRAAEAVGVPVEIVSMTDRYRAGDLEEATRTIFERIDRAREVLAEYQDSIDETYVPFQALCGECGRLTDGITAVDVEEGVVEYECTDTEVAGNVIEGCGHQGAATFREGKLPWRFEWPAQWETMGVDFEPFGKDHAEGSWPSGVEIAREVFDSEPPVGMVYEWFTVDGEALSSSSGVVVTVEEVLEVLEPEVFRYFFTKDPRKARDFSFETLDQLVDEFDRFERVYFDEVAADEEDRERAERAYPMVVEEVRPDRIRIPYTFAAVLGMTDDPALREEIARREGHIPDDAPDWAVREALGRVERAQAWAARTGNAYSYDLRRESIPEVNLDPAVAAALSDVANVVAEGADGEAVQAEIYDAADRHDVSAGEVFEAGYRLLFDQPEGPKLGPFLANLDREFVVTRLRREG